MKRLTMLLGILFFSQSIFAVELMTVKEYLKSELGNKSKLSKEAFELNAKQKKDLEKVAPSATESSFTFYFAKSVKGKLEIACTIVPQQGKEGAMSVGVCFSPDGIVKSVKLLSYEEERGKPVKEQSFLKQFVGKNISSAFEVGKDIDGLSGATRSSKAVSEAVRKSSFGFKTFVKK